MNDVRQKNQAGFVSIVVAITIITVLAMITVGFAQLSRREQQNALNKQLNSQAFYAAEAGINDAKTLINNKQITSTTTGADGNTCIDLSAFQIDPPGNTNTFDNKINDGNGVSYSCVLIDMQPDSLVYSNVDPGVNKSTTFSTVSPLNSIDVFWKTDNASSGPASIGDFLPSATWLSAANNYPAVIELKIVPLNASFTQADVINSAFTVFLYPSQGGINSWSYPAAIPVNSDLQGPIISGNCTSSGCTAHITSIPSKSQYLVSLHTYYTTANTVTITPKDAGGNKAVTTKGQYTIDVTGKAQDVLKRLQVHIPADDGPDTGRFAIEAQSICKRIETEPGVTNYIVASGGGTATGVDPCNLSN